MATQQECPYRVAVIDNKDDVLFGLRAMLEEQGYEVGLYYSTEDFLDTANPHDFICIFLDYLLGRNRANGLEFLRDNPQVSQVTSVVMMTEFADIPSSFQSAKLGVMAYLPKPILPTQLSEVLRQVQKNSMQALARPVPVENEPHSTSLPRFFAWIEAVTDIEEWHHLLDLVAKNKLSPERKRQLRSLTRREVQVFAKIAESGPTNKEIGQSLHLSEKTIDSHYSSLRDKFALQGLNARAATLKLRDILVELIAVAEKLPEGHSSPTLPFKPDTVAA